jgi:hypothetical protein
MPGSGLNLLAARAPYPTPMYPASVRARKSMVTSTSIAGPTKASSGYTAVGEVGATFGGDCGRFSWGRPDVRGVIWVVFLYGGATG